MQTFRIRLAELEMVLREHEVEAKSEEVWRRHRISNATFYSGK
jgi:hypothetical protein